MVDTTQVAVTILDKEYLIGCPEGERERLTASARLLDRKMREIRSTGRVIGADRVAVMAALNIAHELIQCRDLETEQERDLRARLKMLQEKIDAVLEEGEGSAPKL